MEDGLTFWCFGVVVETRTTKTNANIKWDGGNNQVMQVEVVQLIKDAVTYTQYDLDAPAPAKARAPVGASYRPARGLGACGMGGMGQVRPMVG